MFKLSYNVVQVVTDRVRAGHVTHSVVIAVMPPNFLNGRPCFTFCFTDYVWGDFFGGYRVVGGRWCFLLLTCSSCGGYGCPYSLPVLGFQAGNRWGYKALSLHVPLTGFWGFGAFE